MMPSLPTPETSVTVATAERCVGPPLVQPSTNSPHCTLSRACYICHSVQPRSWSTLTVLLGTLVQMVFLPTMPALADEGSVSYSTCSSMSTRPLSNRDGPVPRVADISATSLATIGDDWEVVTFVYLQATDITDEVSFRITEPPVKGELLDFRDGAWCRLVSPYVTRRSRLLRYPLRYVPYRNEVGRDTFRYRGRVTGRESRDAVATIDIERGGVTWQVITNVSSGFSEGTPSVSENKAIGATAPDAVFRLDWQWLAPRRAATLTERVIRTDSDSTRKDERRRSVHTTLITGFVQRPLAMAATPIDTASSVSGTECSGEPKDTIAPEPELAYRRAFTVGGEARFGGVVDLDGQGTFAEVGATLGGYFDTFLGSGRPVPQEDILFVDFRPINSGTSYYRFETGLYVSFKQLSADSATALISTGPAKNVVLQPRNVNDLFVAQFLYQIQNSLDGLVPEHLDGSSRHRFAFRFMAMPPFPGAIDGARFLLGIEASQGLWNRRPRDVRLFYGVDVSPHRLFR